MTLAELNALPADEAVRALLQCCGSTKWARAMAASRPFANMSVLASAADVTWAALGLEDWLEAFAAHPRIGEQRAGGAGRTGGAGESGRAGRAGRDWSAQEQAGVTDESRERFVDLNREYETRFGHIFIVCATGKSAREMLDILERRMLNKPEDELVAAAEQQRQIMQLRLAKLIVD